MGRDAIAGDDFLDADVSDDGNDLIFGDNGELDTTAVPTRLTMRNIKSAN